MLEAFLRGTKDMERGDIVEERTTEDAHTSIDGARHQPTPLGADNDNYNSRIMNRTTRREGRCAETGVVRWLFRLGLPSCA